MSVSCAVPPPPRIAGFGVNKSSNPRDFQLGQVLAKPTSLPTVVHLARLRNRERHVVVKKYNIDQLQVSEGGEDVGWYIQHEVSSMKLFQHHNLIQCLASFVVGQEVWLVTPYMSLGSVRDLLSSQFQDGLPELACAFIIRDVLNAMEYLHCQGVVHRSVRASHILLHESGTAVLGGFRYCTSLHATGENRTNLYDYPLHAIGTNLYWLAPEILQQNLLGYNETSDIYSLGVTACEMANAIVPYSDLPATLMLLEKLRGAAPRLMDSTTLNQPEGQEDEMAGFPGHPADSGVGESVGSCNLIGKDSAYFTREFSAGFHSLVRDCTVLLSNERPNVEELLASGFIKQLRKTTVSLLGLLQPIQAPPPFQPDQEEEGLIVEQLESMRVDDMSVGDWDFD